jgi:hypothetical protein
MTPIYWGIEPDARLNGRWIAMVWIDGRACRVPNGSDANRASSGKRSARIAARDYAYAYAHRLWPDGTDRPSIIERAWQ